MNEFALLGAVLLSGVLTLAAVALGGVLVFRTKKESHEKLFQVRRPELKIGSYADDLTPHAAERLYRNPFAVDGPSPMPTAEDIFGANATTMEQNKRLMEQMAEEKLKEKGQQQ